jgi:hypothetical protein
VTAVVTFVSFGALAALSACGGDDACDPDAPGTICTIAGGDEIVARGDDGPAIDARFNEPQDVIAAPDGSLWITDFNFYNLRAIGPDGIIRRVAGTTMLGDSPPEGMTEQPCLEAAFNHFPTLHFHDGYAYMAAWHNRRIKRIKLDTMTIENYAGTGAAEQYYGDGGPKDLAAVDLPSGVTTDPMGRVVWMSQADQVIRRVDLDGTVERIVGFCIAGEQVTACAPGQVPTQCPGNSRYTCGDVSLCEDTCWPSFGGDGGLAINARIAQGYGQSAKPGGRLLYDPEGNLFFADRDNNRIRKVDTNGIISTVAGNGTGGYSGDGGPALDASLYLPIDVELAPDGTLYFTDTGNNCVRKVAPDGIISTVAGSCASSPTGSPPVGGGFSGDGGKATEAQLKWPFGIELVGNKLYIADSFNHRVRVVNL